MISPAAVGCRPLLAGFRYGPGTRVTEESRYMGDTLRHTSRSQEGPDAVAGDVMHGPADAVHQRFQRGLLPVTELAERFGISRKTAYKWIDRYEDGGPPSLVDRSRRPLSCPHATPRRRRDGGARGPPASSALGREEAAPHPAAESARDGLAGSEHRLRPLEATRPRPDDTPAVPAVASGAVPSPR